MTARQRRWTNRSQAVPAGTESRSTRASGAVRGMCQRRARAVRQPQGACRWLWVVSGSGMPGVSMTKPADAAAGVVMFASKSSPRLCRANAFILAPPSLEDAEYLWCRCVFSVIRSFIFLAAVHDPPAQRILQRRKHDCAPGNTNRRVLCSALAFNPLILQHTGSSLVSCVSTRRRSRLR